MTRCPALAQLGTERDRKEKRLAALQEAQDMVADAELYSGDIRAAKLREANEYFQKAITIPAALVNMLLHALRSRSVRFVVAPYEADAQMAYMAATGEVAGIITEDSDLVVFLMAAAVTTASVVYKMDGCGNANILAVRSPGEMAAAGRAIGGNVGTFLRELKGMTHRMFVQACALGG